VALIPQNPANCWSGTLLAVSAAMRIGDPLYDPRFREYAGCSSSRM
jgi:hypothetical protein